MQALVCEVWRARTKLGMAIAASKPMMATTIMISTRVKPALLEVLIFIFYLAFRFSFSGVNLGNRRFITKYMFVRFTYCLLQPQQGCLAPLVPRPYGDDCQD